ncbi:MAG: DUF2817 domain-containing protein [Anaerolineae bacterium]|nr:DUF2817 domain-containing protein [Anaerolineae bacterium]
MSSKKKRIHFLLVGLIWFLVFLTATGLLAAVAVNIGAPSVSQSPANDISGPAAPPTGDLPPPAATNTTGPAIIHLLGTPFAPIYTPTGYPTPVGFSGGPIVIGYSVLGRPIEVFRFGTGPRQYMIIGGIHGGYEVNTVKLTDALIAHISQNHDLIPSDVTLFILRAFNPDGLQLPYEVEGRANANNVDLNRNFPIDWHAEWPRQGCWNYLPTTAGGGPASEPETQALMTFIMYNPVIALISYHAAAPGFYPAGDPPFPSSDRLSRTLSQASGYPYPAVDVGCHMTGSLVDWVASTGAAAADLELTDYWEIDWDRNLRLLPALLNWLP